LPPLTRRGVTIVLVTREHDLTARATRVLTVRDRHWLRPPDAVAPASLEEDLLA
jgi:hypothetical protein